jgi:Putative esterase
MKLVVGGLLLVTSTVAFGSTPSDGWSGTCAKFHSPSQPKLNVDYCIYSDPASTSADVLYYLSCRGSGATMWVEEMEGVRARWKALGLSTPTVVTISVDLNPVIWWILVDHNSDGSTGLYPVFVNEFMPMVENQLGGVKGRRLLVGRSMGGFNASQLLLRMPEKFDRVALLCPAILSISPYADHRDDEAYLKRSKGSPLFLFLVKLFMRSSLEGVGEWNEVSPLELGKTALGPETPPLHVSCGDIDHYGFHDGAEKFAALAKSLSSNEVVWQSLHGNHCTFDPVSIADFILAQ